MNVTEFYKKASEKKLISEKENHYTTSVMRNPALGVMVETKVSFNLAGRKDAPKYYAIGSKFVFQNLKMSDYDKLVKVAQHKFNDPKLQHTFVAKNLMENHDPVVIYNDQYIVDDSNLNQPFKSAIIQKYDSEMNGLPDKNEISRFLDGLKNIAVLDVTALDKSSEYKKSIDDMNPKALIKLSIEIKELLKSENENSTSDYPDKTYEEVAKVIGKVNDIGELPMEGIQNSKKLLIESLELIKKYSERHYIFHDDMEKRDQERNESFDDSEDERYAEEAYENSASDFKENQSTLNDEIFYAQKRLERFVDAVSELNKELINSPKDEMTL